MDADKEGLLLTQATSWVARYQEAARALREEASEPAVHGYRIAARRLLALLALWRPLTYHPELERRLLRSVGRLSALRDAQVYAERFGKSPASTGNTHKSACRVPLLSRRLARWLAAVAQVQDAWALALLYQQHLALRLDEAQSAHDEPIPCVGKSASSRQQQLRRWHRLRLEIKQARYGVELLLDLGSGDPGWLSTLTHWQERLGQLQDWRQWRRRLRAEQGNTRKQTKLRQQLKGKITARLCQLDCQQAELVALKLAMQAGHNVDDMPSRLVRYSEQNVSSTKSTGDSLEAAICRSHSRPASTKTIQDKQVR
ncbi:CHAD domain-containing protein [Aeromonas veronii]|uniref:CHAD domain-containing protein n=1 Tax=Aeromonas veronii TaxID=654 RepID=UPI001F44BF0B|nr:CHAD domain-containing protein [Aeromonas veronii]